MHEQLPGIVGVLAAGNHMCVALRDTMAQLVAHNNLVVIKMNPVNDWVGPHLECILEPFIERGFVQVVYGGASVAQVTFHSHLPACSRHLPALQCRIAVRSVDWQLHGFEQSVASPSVHRLCKLLQVR